MPVPRDQTFNCSQITTRMGEQFPYEGQMAVDDSQACHPSQVMTSSSDHTCGYNKRILNNHLTFQNHLQAPGAYQIFYKQQKIDPNSAQINHYGQLVSSHSQNVYRGQGTVPSVEECLHPQVISISSGNSSLHSGGPLAPRQPSKSVSVSVFVQGHLQQDNSHLETKTHIRKPYFCT